MFNRIEAAAVVLAVAVLGACTPRPQTPLGGTASVTVNSNEAKFQIVKCTQVEWYRKIEIGGDFAGAHVASDARGEPVTVKYSQGDGDDATTSLSSGKFTISGTAHGYQVDKPTEPATATFKILVTC